MSSKNHKQAHLYYNFSRALVRKGDLDGAIAHLEKALAISPDWTFAQQSLENLQKQKEQILEKQVLERSDSQYQLAKSLLEKGEYEQAIAHLKKAIEINPVFLDAYYSLADIWVKLEKQVEAIEVYEKLLGCKSDLWEVHHKLGNLYRDLARWDKAISAYQKSIELKADFCWNYYNLGDVFFQLQEWERAIAVYERAIELKSDFAWGYYKLGDCCFNLEQWDRAVSAYRSAIKFDAHLPEIHAKLGDALQYQAEIAAKEVSQVYRQAIQENPTDLQLYYKALEVNPQDVEISLKLADVLRSQGKLEQAITFYKRVLDITVSDVSMHGPAWHSLGDVLQEVGKSEKAIDAYRNSLNIAYDSNIEKKLNILLQNNLWQEKQQLGIELESVGKLEDALFAYRRATTLKFDPLYAYYQALEVNPNNYLLYLNLGNALAERDMFSHAIVFYKQGLKLKPNSLDINLKLGKLLLKQNKFKKAIPYFNEVIKIDSECFDGYCGLAEAQEKISRTPSYDVSLSEDKDILKLTKEPLWVTLPVYPETPYYLFGESSSPQLPTDKQALIQFEFLDHNQKLIPQPYSGISISETLGPYFYISTNGENLSTFNTKVFDTPSTAKYLRLGFRTWHNKKDMIVSSKVKLFFDSAPYVQESIVNYQKALKIKPYDYMIINKLGDLLEKQGKLADALSYYHQVLKVSYHCNSHTNQAQEFNKRVLFPLHLSLPYQQTGYTIRSQSILKSLKEKGINVLAITPLGYPHSFLPDQKIDNISDTEIIDGIEYHRLKSEEKLINIEQSYSYIEKYADSLAKIAKSYDASVIHGASNFVTGMAGFLAARKIGIKSIYEFRGFWYLSAVANGQKIRDSCWLNHCQLMESAVVRQVDAVVTLSSVMKEELITWGVAPNKITVIPNGVDINQFKPVNPDIDLQKKLGLDNYFVVSFIGSLNEYEGIDLLIEAVVRLINQGNKIKLLIVGKGPAQEELENLVDSNKIKNHVVFIGQIPFAEISNYYALSDVCVFPRKSARVCQLVPPLKLLEPLAMGKPVIVSALPPLLDVIKHEETGLVCLPDNVESLVAAIAKIYNNINLATELGNSAINWVKANRQWSMICERYLEFYENLFTLG